MRKIIKEAQDNLPVRDAKFATQVSAEAAALITKSAELLIADIAEHAGAICIRENHQALLLSDVTDYLYHPRNLHKFPFLREIIPKKVPLSHVAAQQRLLAQQQQQAQALLDQEADD